MCMKNGFGCNYSYSSLGLEALRLKNDCAVTNWGQNAQPSVLAKMYSKVKTSAAKCQMYQHSVH